MIASAKNYRPTEVLVRKASRLVEIVWDDQTLSRYLFTTLRANCRCTECRSLGLRSGRETVAASRDIEITDVRPIGTYALQFVFSDGHARGIFPFRYLREMAA